MKTKIQKILLLILMTFFTLISFGVLILLFDKKNEIGDFIAYLIIFTITGFLYYYWKTFDERKAKKLDSIYIKKEKKLNNIYTQNVKKLKDRYNEKEKQLENQYIEKEKKLNNIYTQNEEKLKDRYNEKEKQLENQLLKKDTDVEPSINLTSHESNNNFYNFKKVHKYEEKKPNFNIHKCHKVKIIVAGTSFRQKEIKRLLRDFDYYEKYDGLSTRDIKENYYEGDKIYEIPLSAIHYGNCELIPEPNNKYDKNAIKVIIDKIHVGYTPRKDCTFINGILNDIKDIDIEVYGGKYKEIYFDEEDYKEKVKINEKNLGILLYISYLDRG